MSTYTLFRMRLSDSKVDIWEEGLEIEAAIAMMSDLNRREGARTAEVLDPRAFAFIVAEQGPGYGAWRILLERQRHVENEHSYLPALAGEHTLADLLSAAIAYSLAASDDADLKDSAQVYWPWGIDAFNPETPLRDLERAGALIAAEYDRRISEGKTP